MTTLEIASEGLSPLRHLHNTQVSLEKFRISLGNRVSAISRGVDGAERPVPEIYERLHQMAADMESEIDRAIASELENWPVYNEWLRYVKGIGSGLAGQMLSLLLPPIPEKGPSSWYRAAGLVAEARIEPQRCPVHKVAWLDETPEGEPDVSFMRCPEKVQENGSEAGCPERPSLIMRMPRARVGEGKITYHPWLRRCLFNVSTSFVRLGGYYREVYDRGRDQLFHLHCWDAANLLDGWKSTSVTSRASWLEAHVSPEVLEKVRGKEALVEWAVQPTQLRAIHLVGVSDPNWPLNRVDSAARWRMIRLFLSHLWEAWCEAEGIEKRAPYVVERMGHQYIPRPLPTGTGKI
jgi:hypothetical protein